jgi:iron complex outermembrane receptor protein
MKNNILFWSVAISLISLTLPVQLNAQNATFKFKLFDEQGTPFEGYVAFNDDRIKQKITQGYREYSLDSIIQWAKLEREISIFIDDIDLNFIEVRKVKISTDIIEKNTKDNPYEIDINTNKHKSIADNSEPIVTITAEQLATTGKQTLEEALVYLVPSFYATWQTVADRSRYVTPSSLKGLGPDQFLVLINGKRRHSTSILHINGGFGRGTQSNDLVNINLSSVKAVQILTTAASVKYGSDAIAGVINIILIDKAEDYTSSGAGFQGGIYSRPYSPDDELKWWKDGKRNGDEMEGKIWFRLTNTLGKKGSKTLFHIGGDLIHLGSINRSGAYQGTAYKNTTIIPETFWDNTGYNPASKRVMEIGRSKIQQSALHFNVETPLFERGKMYAFGGFSHKIGRGSGFYRFPKDTSQVVQGDTIGFLPQLLATIDDDFLTVGATLPTDKMGHFDVSYSMGGNSIDYYVENSVNADLGKDSPKNFYGGRNFYRQNIVALNWNTQNLLPKKYNNSGLSFDNGFSIRYEKFGIQSGDEASYYAVEGNNKQSGSQIFAGFSKEHELEKPRTNHSAFTQAKWTWRPCDNLEIAVNGGLRYETYTNQDGSFIKKGSLGFAGGNWKVHFSGNEGFRAPSLAQIYYTGLSSQYRGNEAFRVFVGNNESNIARYFGVETLKPETSNSWNSGIGYHYGNKFSINADYSLIDLKDRIIISGFFDTKNPIFKDLLKSQEKNDVNSALFFINFLTTRTHNVDLTSTWNIGTNHHLLLGFNWNQTSVNTDSSRKSLPEKLKPFEKDFFNREEKSRYEEIIPSWKLFLMWNGQCSIKSNFLTWKLQGTLFGNNYYRDPVNANFDQVYENWKTPIGDLELGYKIKSGINIAFGCNNVFDARSNKIEKPANLSSVEEKSWFENISYYNLFQYSRRVQTFGVGGSFWYLKMSYQIGQKDRKNR